MPPDVTRGILKLFGDFISNFTQNTSPWNWNFSWLTQFLQEIWWNLWIESTGIFNNIFSAPDESLVEKGGEGDGSICGDFAVYCLVFIAV